MLEKEKPKELAAQLAVAKHVTRSETAAINILKRSSFPTVKCYLFMQIAITTTCSIFAIA